MIANMFSFLRGRLRTVGENAILECKTSFHSFEVGFGLTMHAARIKGAAEFSFLRGRLRTGGNRFEWKEIEREFSFLRGRLRTNRRNEHDFSGKDPVFIPSR